MEIATVANEKEKKREGKISYREWDKLGTMNSKRFKSAHSQQCQCQILDMFVQIPLWGEALTEHRPKIVSFWHETKLNKNVSCQVTATILSSHWILAVAQEGGSSARHNCTVHES